MRKYIVKVWEKPFEYEVGAKDKESARDKVLQHRWAGNYEYIKRVKVEQVFRKLIEA